MDSLQGCYLSRMLHVHPLPQRVFSYIMAPQKRLEGADHFHMTHGFFKIIRTLLFERPTHHPLCMHSRLGRERRLKREREREREGRP
jgi:hypothetical protein